MTLGSMFKLLVVFLGSLSANCAFHRHETPLSVKADVIDRPPFNRYDNNTYPVFVIESLGWSPENHGGLYVVTERNEDAGYKFDIEGKVTTGFKYRCEGLPRAYRIDEMYFIGYIKKVDWKKFETICKSIKVPGPQKEVEHSPGNLEREEAKCCHNWTCQAVELLIEKRLLVVDRDGFANFKKSNEEHRKAFERVPWEKPWKPLRGLDGQQDDSSSTRDELILK